MGGTPGVGSLHLPGTSIVHRLPARAKLIATLAFVLAVVVTPARVPLAFVAHAAAILTVARVAAVPSGLLVRRLRVEVPFLAFAAVLPFIGGGERRSVLGVSISEDGLLGAWNIVAKATLGLLAAVVLTSTTPTTDLLRALDRLGVPRVLTAIAGFMVRYLDVIVGEARRMRIARLSRGSDPRWLWQARSVAATGGTLFVRSFERGERVHLAMAARGYTGTMPASRSTIGGSSPWWAATVPTVAVVVAGAAWWSGP